jgi:hypothetical protein
VAEHLGNQIEVTIVASGHPTALSVPLNQRLEQVVRRVLNDTGNTGQGPDGWELRNQEGAVLALGATVKDAGIPTGATLFLNPIAGAGG